jgi:hypothetical protein
MMFLSIVHSSSHYLAYNVVLFYVEIFYKYLADSDKYLSLLKFTS